MSAIASPQIHSEMPRSLSGSNDDGPAPLSLLGLPAEMILEIFSHLSLGDVGRMQQVNKLFYNFILNDPSFTYYNTFKFFELYYQRETLAVYLFPYINPRMSYYGLLLNKQEGSRSLVPNGDDLASGNTVFHIAAANGLKETIEYYLTREKQGVLNFRPFDQRLRYNREASEIIRLKDENRDCLLAEMENDEPNTALHYISIIPEATNVEHVLGVARSLFRMGGIDYTRKGRAGNTALCEAAQHGQEEMVHLIVEEVRRRLTDEAMAQVYNLGSPFSGRSDRRLSRSGRDQLLAVNGDRHCLAHSAEEVVKRKLAEYINTPNEYSENAVILSARASPAILHYLLEHGGDPNSRRRGSPLIHIVCSLFMLDRQDPDIFLHYHDNRSVNFGVGFEGARLLSHEHLESADATKEKAQLYKQVLRSLLQFGVDANARHETTGMKPLHMASFWGYTDAIEVLVKEHGIDPDREVNLRNNWLPMHYACDEGQLFAIYLLLSFGADVWDAQEAAEVRKKWSEDGIPDDERDILDRVKLHAPSPLEMVRVDDHRVRLLMLNQALRSRRNSNL